jgi:histone deacetylase HOS2
VIDPKLPETLPFRNTFRPDYTLFPPLSEMRKVENKNSKQYLESVTQAIMEQLRYIKGAPSVQMSVIPPDIMGIREEVDRALEEDQEMKDAEREDREGAGSGTQSRRRESEKGLGISNEHYA